MEFTLPRVINITHHCPRQYSHQILPFLCRQSGNKTPIFKRFSQSMLSGRVLTLSFELVAPKRFMRHALTVYHYRYIQVIAEHPDKSF